jgi:ABC-2 type transport system ATP-binding protein
MTSAIHTHALSKDFGSLQAVRGIDLEVRRGEIYGFLGRNGAGKTTTIRMLLGLIRPSGGEIRIFGEPARGKRLAALGKVGFLVEAATAYPNLTVRENLELQRILTSAPKGAVEEAIARLGLDAFADRKSAHLSLGNKQRLSLARALIHSPELLVLDEPANGLDPAGIVEIRELLRSLAHAGTTIFMSSHILAEVDQLADRIGIIHEGRLVEEVDRRDREKAERVAIEVRAEESEAAELALAAAGIKSLRRSSVQENLEDHFMRITGGRA